MPRSLDEDPATFLANPTAEGLLAASSMLALPLQQWNDDPLSSSVSAGKDAPQAFKSNEYLQDFALLYQHLLR